MHGRMLRLVVLIELRLVIFHILCPFFVSGAKIMKIIRQRQSFDFNYFRNLLLRVGRLARELDAEHTIAHAGIDRVLHHIFRKDEGLLELGV